MSDTERYQPAMNAIRDALRERWGWGNQGSSEAVAKIAYDAAVEAGMRRGQEEHPSREISLGLQHGANPHQGATDKPSRTDPHMRKPDLVDAYRALYHVVTEERDDLADLVIALTGIAASAQQIVDRQDERPRSRNGKESAVAFGRKINDEDFDGLRVSLGRLWEAIPDATEEGT